MSEQAGTAMGGFTDYLGLTLGETTGDRVRATIDVTPQQHQPYGIVHGGVFCAVIETVASIGAALWFGERGHCVGVHNSTHFVRAVRDGQLHVDATPLHRGRTQQLWQVFIHDESERLVSKGEVRLANVASSDALGSS